MTQDETSNLLLRKMMDIQKLIHEVCDLEVALEREACALVADESIDFWVKKGYPESAEVREAQNIAEAIRARGYA